MKRILVLSMTLVLSFAPTAVVFAQEENSHRAVNPGEDPNELTGRTYRNAATEGGAGVIGLADDCPTCAARRSSVNINKNTNPSAKGSGKDADSRAQGGTQ